MVWIVIYGKKKATALKTTASLVGVTFVMMILVRKAHPKSTNPLRHIASYDRSNVRCDDSKKDQAKEKKNLK